MKFLSPIQAIAGIVGNLTGNADTATKLKTARTINGVSFDGSANVSIPVVGSTANVTLYTNTTGIASGNLTMPQSIYNFRRLAVVINGLVLGADIISGRTAIRAYLVNDNGTNHVTYGAAFTASSDGLTLTLTGASGESHTASDSHGTRAAYNVTAIYGVY